MKKKNKRKKKPLREPVKQEIRIHHHDIKFEMDGVRYTGELKIWKELKNASS